MLSLLKRGVKTNLVKLAVAKRRIKKGAVFFFIYVLCQMVLISEYIMRLQKEDFTRSIINL
ncbi:hypothetical protein COS52_05050 [Candidatus Roizmanbacteria bacterium CG03_land_8_20_14_0_80_39_12]|uniref:Uncharacterized protein n=1 Tax=Candidatus Roizmanbacteria bacterium CG03_land_8_20_14_0_80_39_12 TaxID=1974847 RepID=A0A2M7BR92_9BACT|nr:MAG: hypothetical protein COS52_05050 [Candidatus Roizmanbacteria bacterium CG03_land_8_20_14_0_80_39_12]